MEKNEQIDVSNKEVKYSLNILRTILFIFCISLAGCASLHGSIFMKDPLSAEEHNNLGVIYEREGKYNLAIREYKRAIHSDTTLITPLVNLGNVYFRKGEYTEAEKYYKRALKNDETNLEAANNLASLYIETGVDYETGLQLMIRATNNLEEIPPYALDTLGVLYLNLGSKVEAEKFLIEACSGVKGNDILKQEIRSHLLELGINKRCEQ
jgi:tetratricopeptide (TPR) repeat protein